MAEALLALGGNVGNVRDTLTRAIATLCDGQHIRLTARSSDYVTPPWGVEDQPPFVNLCIVVATTLAPHALLHRAQDVERAFVLVPLAEIAPTRMIAGVRVDDALGRVDNTGIKKLPPP